MGVEPCAKSDEGLNLGTKRIILCSWYVLASNRLFTFIRRTGKPMIEISNCH